MSRLRDFISFLNGFRKLTICFLVIISATALLLTKYITSDNYTAIMTITVPAYFAGNVGEHLTSVVKDWIKSKSTTIKSEVKQAMQDIKDKVVG